MRATERHDEDGKPYLAYFRNDLTMSFMWSGNLGDQVQVTREAGEPIIATFTITGDQLHAARQANQHNEDSRQVLLAFKDLCDEWAKHNVATELFGIPIRAALIVSEHRECRHCGRTIFYDASEGWIDPQATGDDNVWRSTCDSHDTFTADHEPKEN